MSTDHAKAKEWAEHITLREPYVNENNWDNLAACYLDLVKQHGELREALEFYGNQYVEIDGNKIWTTGAFDHGKRARETLGRIGRAGE